MLTLQNVRRTFDSQPVLRGVDLSIARGQIACLLGPSGCGKTTLLRIIAGLEGADSGDVLLDGDSVMRVPVHARDFGLMFQDFALFPHLNVADNVAFGLRMHGLPRAQQAARLHEVLALVGLSDFEARDVSSLSGGERQRVALARSLAPNPRLLMLDEPLGSLDAALRERLVVELRAIIKHVGLTALYVTHDQREAFAIADVIAVMNAGRIEQVASAEDLYRRPATTFVARFLGLRNIFPVIGWRDGAAITSAGVFPAPQETQALLLHPDDLRLTAPETPGALPATIVERVFLGDSYRCLALHNEALLMFKLPAHSAPPAVGAAVALLPTRIVPLAS
ncbi:MAG: ABC transporter ATP-binding protein [Chloroflexi bacterium]|nr:ABC transporter ATP-binding protein [Chloroflexota bacterium]